MRAAIALGSFACVGVAVAAAGERDARADDVRVDTTRDSAITIAALALAAVPELLPVPHTRWQHELFGAADRHDRFAPGAAPLADATLAATMAAPLAYLADAGGTRDRYAIYGETLAVDLALVQIAKRVVHRPRPYTYNPDARAYTERAGDDAYLSFYSSHSAMAFGAATAGAYLLSASGASPAARDAAWGLGFFAASATANLRVRAGKHFYSDVVVGALVGIGVGYAVPALHATGAAFTPSRGEVGLAGAGLAAGAIASELIPLSTPHASVDGVTLAPMLVPHGAGIAMCGRLTLHAAR